MMIKDMTMNGVETFKVSAKQPCSRGKDKDIYINIYLGIIWLMSKRLTNVLVKNTNIYNKLEEVN